LKNENRIFSFYYHTNKTGQKHIQWWKTHHKRLKKIV
jgi:hypothetical protein